MVKGDSWLLQKNVLQLPWHKHTKQIKKKKKFRWSLHTLILCILQNCISWVVPCDTANSSTSQGPLNHGCSGLSLSASVTEPSSDSPRQSCAVGNPTLCSQSSLSNELKPLHTWAGCYGVESAQFLRCSQCAFPTPASVTVLISSAANSCSFSGYAASFSDPSGLLCPPHATINHPSWML